MAKAKVLLASSTKIGLELMRRFLRDLDLCVITAEDGLSALDMAQKHHPQLIFMDVDLSGKSGVECCWQLRSSEYGRRVPIVLITTGHSWDTEACLAAGCNEVLSKPLVQSLFVSLGHKLLGSIERRKSRLSCRSTVHCQAESGNFYGTIEDIGPHGIFVGTPQVLKNGERIRLRFVLPWPEAVPLISEGTVAWVNSGRNRKRLYLPDGYGIVFSHPPATLVEHIEEYIEHSILLLNPLDEENP